MVVKASLVHVHFSAKFDFSFETCTTKRQAILQNALKILGWTMVEIGHNKGNFAVAKISKMVASVRSFHQSYAVRTELRIKQLYHIFSVSSFNERA